MAAWSQVFDDGAVLAQARRRARGLVFGFALASGALVSAAPLASLWGGVHGNRLALLCGVILCALAGWILTRLTREHRRVWRVEVSALGLAAHDVAGRRTAVLWRAVERVDLADDGVTVTGRDAGGRRLRVHVRAATPDFGALARRITTYAHAHRCALSVDGTPVDALSLDALAARAEKKTRRGGSADPEPAG